MNVNTVNAKTEHRRVNETECDPGRAFSQRECLSCLSADYHALGCPLRCKCGECEIADNNEIAEQMVAEDHMRPTCSGLGLWFVLIVDDKDNPKATESFVSFEVAREYARTTYTQEQRPTLQYLEVEL